MTITEAPEVPHPRILQRREEVADASQRSRKRKLVATAVVGALVALAALATQSPLLDVDEVRVVGALRSSPDELRQVAEVELGAPLLGFDHAAVEQRIRALPQVSNVASTSDWSGVVTIEVAERLPAAKILFADGAIIVATDGVVLKISESDEFAGLPTISGVMVSAITPGELAPSEVNEALQVVNELPGDVSRITERVEITVDSLVLRVVGGGAVALGDSRDLDAKFDAVRAFLDQVDLSCLESLNVQAPRVPVIVRTPNCT